MRPRYYVHMGPRTADKVSSLWKGLHVTIFILIFGSAYVATHCIYNILKIYNFHCILYAKITFEDTYEERMMKANVSVPESTLPSNETMPSLNCTAAPDDPDCKQQRQFHLSRRLSNGVDWRAFETQHTSGRSRINNTGFINMRKTTFATIYMCDLMFFSPLASIIMSIFLISLTIVAGKGGAGSPGDLLPNPWICVYPFLGLCGFMTVFSAIAQKLFSHGLSAFCSRYIQLTGTMLCSEKMDVYNVQFADDQKSPRPFSFYYYYGDIALQATCAMWIFQGIVYIFRILCLADFTTYMTRIKLKTDQKVLVEPKMANVVMKVVKGVDSKVKNI